MNMGLSPLLLEYFPNSMVSQRPEVKLSENINPYWLAGFIDGEGCFYINLAKSELNPQVKLNFSIAQHSRDMLLMEKIQQYLKCGRLDKSIIRPDEIAFVVNKIIDINDKIIPFIRSYPIHRSKLLDF